MLIEKPELKDEISRKDTRLDSHELTKRMEGGSSFSIDGDVRVVYEWTSKNTVRFLKLGGHKKVYGV